jgi:hypothetical protein
MRLATIDDVLYVQQSTLIPHELKPEVQEYGFEVPPVVMSHCLRFLCYHHLHNIVKRQQSLRDLDRTIKEGYLIGIFYSSSNVQLLIISTLTSSNIS